MSLPTTCRSPSLRPCKRVHLTTRCGCCSHSSAKASSSRTYCSQNSTCARQPESHSCDRQSAAENSQRQQHGHHLALLLATAAPLLQVTPAWASEDAEQAYTAAVANYVPSPYTPGWEVWFGAIVATIPFVLGAWEFGKRIIIQQRCEVCAGSGLVMKGKFPKKCPQCGGFFPWVGWRYFFLSTATPGNGGPLLQPKGQTSVFYKVPPAPAKLKEAQPAGQQQAEGQAVEGQAAEAPKPADDQKQ